MKHGWFNVSWLAAWLFLAQSFWQTKPASAWTDLELARFLVDSPWAQMAVASGPASSAPFVQVYLLTAEPIANAVAERNRRAALRRPVDPKLASGPLREEFAAWLADNRARHVIVAARIGDSSAFSRESETRRIEQESVMEVGRAHVKVSGYFPPSASDPYLYLAFPRDELPAPAATAKTITFQLYFPGVSAPFRSLEFKIKDMLVDGKLEF